MKKFWTPLFLLLILLASSAFAQPALVSVYYAEDGTGVPPLRSLCFGEGVALPDGAASICVFWDNNNNGPDAADIQPPATGDSMCYGCVTWNCQPLNGEASVGEPGYFVADPLFVVHILPDSAGHHARYYFKISVNYNNDQSCYLGDSVYTFNPGALELFLHDEDFTCTSGAVCPSNVTPPAAPTGVVATDNTQCLAIDVTWQHDGQNVSGFNLYDQNGFLASAASTARATTLFINDDLVHNIYVKASNVGGESPASNTDAGSTYLWRFAEGPTGDISGNNWGGQNFTLTMVRPTQTCPSYTWLLLYNVNTGAITDSVCMDSMTTISCTMPARPDTNRMRVVMRANSIDRPLVWLSDTTESFFRLGGVNADDRDRFVPNEFTLGQNFPNPFNPETTIEFAVPYQSNIKIEVYNVAGQLVRTLVDGSISAGLHRVGWNGLSDNGLTVSTGLYFYRMSGPGFVQTKKMLMMK